MLIYERMPSGDHIWRDQKGAGLGLWRGHSCWYFLTEDSHDPKYLCSLTYTDSEAIQMYRAKLQAMRMRCGVAS